MFGQQNDDIFRIMASDVFNPYSANVENRVSSL